MVNVRLNSNSVADDGSGTAVTYTISYQFTRFVRQGCYRTAEIAGREAVDGGRRAAPEKPHSRIRRRGTNDARDTKQPRQQVAGQYKGSFTIHDLPLS